MKIEVEGVDKAINDIRMTELRKRGRVVQALALTAIAGETGIKRFITNPSPSKPGNPPGVDTNTYRPSWHHRFSAIDLTGDIYTRSDVGPWLEYGTGRSGAASNKQDLPAGYVHGATPGMAARPHAGPFSETLRTIWIKNAKKALSD